MRGWWLAFVALLGAAPASAQTFVTWNVGAAWDGAVEARASQFEAAAAAIGADVYVLQEVTSLIGAETIAGHFGIDNSYVVVSDFASAEEQRQDDDKANVFFHLEVAVISRVPIISATELEFDRQDRTGPLSNRNSVTLNRAGLFVPATIYDRLSPATRRALPFGRGALRVELDGGIVIYAVHAKSDFNGFCADLRSAGDRLRQLERTSDTESGLPLSDIEGIGATRSVLDRIIAAEEQTSFSREWIANAEKREAMFGAIANAAKRDVAEGKTVMVMGDYNIAPNDPRSGTDLDEDCNPSRMCFSPVADTICQGKDGLDESHFIFSSGIDGTPPMKALTTKLTETLTGTFSSAIDHIYVTGDSVDQFTDAVTFKDSKGGGFGSDHLPVVTTLVP